MTDANVDLSARHRRGDQWRTRRIWISGALGVWFAGSRWLLDFWPLAVGPGQNVRSFVDLSRLFLLLPLAGLVAGLLINAGIAASRHHFRRAASNVLAIAVLPISFIVIADAPLVDPWLWYAMANKTHLEARAAPDPATGLRYAVLEDLDVSTGFAGLTPNHFVFLIYDESDSIALEPAERAKTSPVGCCPCLIHPYQKAIDCLDISLELTISGSCILFSYLMLLFGMAVCRTF